MALDHRDLREVRRVDFDDERLGHDLVRDESDGAHASTGRDREVLARDRRDPHRLPHPLRHVRPLDLADRTAALQHEVGTEALQIREHEQIGLVAGSDRAEVAQSVPECRVQRREHDSVLGSDPGLDRLTHHAVDVSVVDDVVGIAVVRAERHQRRPELLGERDERVQVARHRGLADQEPDGGAQPLAALLERERLVVGADPGGGVRVQLLADDAGCMPVDVLRAMEAQLRQLALVAGDDAGEVHHLREAEHAPPAQERLEVAVVEGAPRRLERRGRHT